MDEQAILKFRRIVNSDSTIHLYFVSVNQKVEVGDNELLSAYRVATMTPLDIYEYCHNPNWVLTEVSVLESPTL